MRRISTLSSGCPCCSCFFRYYTQNSAFLAQNSSLARTSVPYSMDEHLRMVHLCLPKAKTNSLPTMKVSWTDCGITAHTNVSQPDCGIKENKAHLLHASAFWVPRTSACCKQTSNAFEHNIHPCPGTSKSSWCIEEWFELAHGTFLVSLQLLQCPWKNRNPLWPWTQTDCSNLISSSTFWHEVHGRTHTPTRPHAHKPKHPDTVISHSPLKSGAGAPQVDQHHTYCTYSRDEVFCHEPHKPHDDCLLEKPKVDLDLRGFYLSFADTASLSLLSKMSTDTLHKQYHCDPDQLYFTCTSFLDQYSAQYIVKLTFFDTKTSRHLQWHDFRSTKKMAWTL